MTVGGSGGGACSGSWLGGALDEWMKSVGFRSASHNIRSLYILYIIYGNGTLSRLGLPVNWDRPGAVRWHQRPLVADASSAKSELRISLSTDLLE